MTTHRLRTWLEPFGAIVAGEQTFILCKDSPRVHVGDRVVLEECGLGNHKPTGAWVTAEITHILRGPLAVRYGLRNGYAALSLHVTERTALASASLPTGGAA